MDFGPHLFLAILEGSITAAVLSLTAVGLSIVFGIMRVVNVAHGEFFMLGAVIAWWITTTIGAHPAIGFTVALLIAPLLVGLVAALSDYLILRRIDYDPERTIVATIGLLYVVQQLTLMSFGPEARPVQAPFNERIALPWFEWGADGLAMIWPWGLGTTTYKLAVVGAAVFILLGLWALMTRTRIGLIMRATQLDRDMALAHGIAVDKVYALVFGLGAALAALGAVLIVPIQQAHYLMGGEPLLLAFIVVIVGGLGSLPGTVLAAVIIGLSDGHNFSVLYSDASQNPRHSPGSICVGVQTPGIVWYAHRMSTQTKSWLLHLGVIALLVALYAAVSEYHSGNVARILVLSVFAMGYNVLFGYTGLLSLGHALFFSVGMYGLGLSAHLLGWTAAPALLVGLICALLISAVIGFLALRTSGVAFMIVTLMFAQAGYLTILLMGTYTRGDEGFVIKQQSRVLAGFDLSQANSRYWFALLLFSVCFIGIAALVRSGFGRTLIAIRENEERARMLGYDVHRYKLLAVILSGVLSGASGAAYALLFGYAGATFATVQYSIFPLLWVLLGGAGTTIGPLIGTAFMFYLIDLSSAFTSAYLLVAGVVLILLTLFAPQGLAGALRKHLMPWLP